MRSFSPIQRVDQNKQPLLNEEGEFDVEPYFISCKELVECGFDEEALICLGIAFAFRMPLCISSSEYFFMTGIFYVFLQDRWLV